MSEQLEVLKLVADRLEQAGMAYMISGSMALNYYAQPRLTRDIDIVIALTSGALTCRSLSCYVRYVHERYAG